MKIYYSRSNEVDDSKVLPHINSILDVIQKYTGKRPKLTMHKRGRDYNPELVDEADFVIVGVDDMKSRTAEIAKGCYTEIIKARELSKSVFVVHTKKNVTGIEWVAGRDCVLTNEAIWQKGYARINLCEKFTDDWTFRTSINNYDHLINNLVFHLNGLKYSFLDSRIGSTYEEYDPVEDDSDDELLLLG